MYLLIILFWTFVDIIRISDIFDVSTTTLISFWKFSNSYSDVSRFVFRSNEMSFIFFSSYHQQIFENLRSSYTCQFVYARFLIIFNIKSILCQFANAFSISHLLLQKHIKIKTTGVHARQLRHVIWSMYDDREFVWIKRVYLSILRI